MVRLVSLIAGLVRRFPWPTIAVVLVVFAVLGSFVPQQVISDGNDGFAPDAPELTAQAIVGDLFGGAGSGSVMQVVVSSADGDVITADGLAAVEAVEAALQSSPLSEDLRDGDQSVISFLAPLAPAPGAGPSVQVVVSAEGGNVIGPEGQAVVDAVVAAVLEGPAGDLAVDDGLVGPSTSFMLPLAAAAAQGPAAQFVVTASGADVMTADGLAASLALQGAVLASPLGASVAADPAGNPSVLGFMTPAEVAVASGDLDPDAATDEVKATWLAALDDLPETLGDAVGFMLPADADPAVPSATRGMVSFALTGPLGADDEAALADVVAGLDLPEGVVVEYLPPSPGPAEFGGVFLQRTTFLPSEAAEALGFLVATDADLTVPTATRGLVVVPLAGELPAGASRTIADDLAALAVPPGFSLGFLPDDPTTAEVEQAYRDRLAFVPPEFADQVTSLLADGSDPTTASASAGLMVVLLDDPSDDSGAALEAFSDRQQAFVDAVDAALLPAGITAGAFSFGLIFAAGGDATAEIGRMFGLAAAIIVVVLLLNFWVRIRGAGGTGRAVRRTVADTLLTLVTILIAITWMQGAGVLLGPDYLGVIGYFNPITQILPILIIGLGVDYGIHMTSRYREELSGGASVADAIGRAVRTVGVALVLATATTVVGFLTNLVSPVPALTDFGILASVGILSAFALMLTFVPAIRLLLDRRGERKGRLRGADFDLSASSGIVGPLGFGALGGVAAYLASVGIRLAIEGGTFGAAFDVLRAGVFALIGATVALILLRLPAITGRASVLAERFAWTVVVVAVLLGGLGEVGRQQLETSFSFTDFVPLDNPLIETFDTLSTDFGGGFGETTNILVGGQGGPAIDNPAVHNAQVDANGSLADTPDVLSFNGSPSVEVSPLVLLADLIDPTSPIHVPGFAEQAGALGLGTDLRVTDDADVAAIYDLAVAAAPDVAATTLHRGPDGYDAALWTVGTGAGEARATALADNLAGVFGPVADEGVEVVPTSEAIISSVVVDSLGDSQLQSLLITLLAATLLLMLNFWVEARRPILGVITILPVALVLLLTFGVMALRGIPFGPVTATISALAVGIGVPFTIHITHRFLEDRVRHGSTEEAIRSTTRHTGGALAGSAFTTMAGFGSLVTSNLVPFRQFGEVTFWAILFALLGSLILLPSMLVIWDRWHRRRGDALLDVSAVEAALDLG